VLNVEIELVTLSPNMFTATEKQDLLTIARQAIARALSTPSQRKRPKEACPEYHGPLAQPGGAFVTLRIAGHLRGCIGYVESQQPIAEVVDDVAVKAALEDPRFPPLTNGELERTEIEVSVLSPMQEVKDVEEIEVGTHGIMMEKGNRRGLLLPQVAREYGWDRDEFLHNTAKKAGLPPGSWMEKGTRIFVFSADVITEEHGR
jgi:uncharacterized protein